MIYSVISERCQMEAASIVNLSDWEFVFQSNDILSRPIGVTRPTKVLKFATAVELVRYLANAERDGDAGFQGLIHQRLKKDKVVREWKRKRTFLKDLQHFPQYRRWSYDQYHDAARAFHAGNASSIQRAMFEGLTAEIHASQVRVAPGQLLFHGRANCDLTTLTPYPSFVSTSLDPVVAINSALRRSGVNRINGPPIVYILTVATSLAALWGQAGQSAEHEVLLPAMLTYREDARFSGTKFEVIQASVASPGTAEMQ